MSSEAFFFDAVVRHSVLLNLYAEALADETEQDWTDVMAAVIGAVMVGGSISAQRRNEILRSYDKAYQSFAKELTAKLTTLASDEANFSTELLRQGTKIPKAPTLATAIQGGGDLRVRTSTVTYSEISSVQSTLEPGRKITYSQVRNEHYSTKRQQIEQILRDTEFEPQGVTAQRLRETIPVTKAHARTIARTGAALASNEARRKTYRDNARLLLGFEWVSTLDNRTTILCLTRDGNIYPFDAPMPPAHYNCRSTTVPAVKPEFDLGGPNQAKRPAVVNGKAESVAQSTTYREWFKRQPKSFQIQVLGKARAELYRKGGLEIEDFIDVYGERITLDQLRALHPMAFEKAGI